MYRNNKRAKQVLDQFQRQVFAERKEFNKEMNNNEGDKRNPLDLMVQNEDRFADDQLRDHIITFISGYETVALALAHAMLLLAMNPHVQDKINEEAAELSDDDLKNSEIVDSLEYLDMAFKETLRLMPTVPMIMRETVGDVEMEPGLVIPKGIVIFINVYALQRTKAIWGDDAHEFNPVRFSYENSKDRHPFAFIPFAFGSRICIASKFSNSLLKVAIVKLLQKFKFSTLMKMDDIRLRSYISLKLCTEHLVSVEKRTRNPS